MKRVITVDRNYGCRRCPFRFYKPGTTKQGRMSRDRSKGSWHCLVIGVELNKGWRATSYEVPNSCPLKEGPIAVNIKWIRKTD